MYIIVRWEDVLLIWKWFLILCTCYVVCPAQFSEISSVKIQFADSKLKANGWSLSRNCIRYFRNMLQLFLVKKMQRCCLEQVRRLSKLQSVWYFVIVVQGEIYYITLISLCFPSSAAGSESRIPSPGNTWGSLSLLQKKYNWPTMQSVRSPGI